MPLLDDSKQRHLLKKAFEAESNDRGTALSTEIADLIKEDKEVTADRAAAYVKALRELQDKLGEYSGLLETGLQSTAASLGILQRQVMTLMKQVKN